ncbi:MULTISPECIES: BRO-N domain-containing protein [Yersinia]|uniref:Phage antirepressor n=2 Tax=Yersinia TaxID=629 RepID=A0A0T9MHC2_YERIN|nr:MULTISPECIES: BRO family protein [Yersinia]AHM72105.2 antirepressor protein [Yersinia hibernica]CNG10678.1 phage antirepressor [Yersinia intermedia]CNK43030.1 phage antirepressor [Yersinia mollaretii]
MTNKNGVSVLCFERHTVRVLQLGGEPWFIAKDVCQALEVVNHRMALKALDDDEKGVNLTYTPGGQQLMRTVSESGFYKLIARSRKASTPNTFAHRFSNWVFREVIPSIRKFGAYGVPWALLHDFTRRSDDSIGRGSQAGKALAIRKVEKHQLESEERLLLDRYQPELKLGVQDDE